MEFTQCHNVQQLSQQNNDNLDITQNQMEMTRNYENWEKTESYMVSLKTNDHDIRYKVFYIFYIVQLFSMSSV